MSKKSRVTATKVAIRDGEISVTDSAVRERLTFSRLTTQDLGRLAHWKKDVSTQIPALIEEFYAHITGFRLTREILEKHSSVDRQRPMITRYVESMTEGVIDDAYIENRRVVGRVHERIDLDSSLYVSMYDIIRRHLVAGVRLAADSKSEVVDFADSLDRLIRFDIGITVGALADTRRDSSNILREAVTSLGSTSREILALAEQQSTNSIDQASSVTETVTAVAEISATASTMAQRAQDVSEAVSENQALGVEGKEAVDQTARSVREIRDKTYDVSERIQLLAQNAASVSEIIASVNDVAEQTNLLALNAAIEASRAGEHGRGFAVVASEIKKLANEAKQATIQVRRILGSIQTDTGEALQTARSGAESASAALEIVDKAGSTINALADVLSETSESMAQISHAAQQQASGVTQIEETMNELNETAELNRAAVDQAERAARDLAELGERLGALSSRSGGSGNGRK
ncbi:MAG: globin-coupled sensor protein [Actinobacteria bacterium]|nr:globin-coupled sensor protein [Actinomycetota bacterium]